MPKRRKYETKRINNCQHVSKRVIFARVLSEIRDLISYLYWKYFDLTSFTIKAHFINIYFFTSVLPFSHSLSFSLLLSSSPNYLRLMFFHSLIFRKTCNFRIKLIRFSCTRYRNDCDRDKNLKIEWREREILYFNKNYKILLFEFYFLHIQSFSMLYATVYFMKLIP